MKTLFKVLVMTIMMITSIATPNAAGFNIGNSKATFCMTAEAMTAIIELTNTFEYSAMQEAGKIRNSGMCSSVPGNTKFEILRYNSVVAEVVFYDNKGTLVEDNPVWVNVMMIDKSSFKSQASSLADRLSAK